MRELHIAGRRIADDAPPWVCAEIGCNHQGDLEKAMQLIQAASECGVDAVKFQKRDLTYWAAANPQEWVRPRDLRYSFGATEGEHRAYLELDWGEYRACKEFAEDRGLVFFATAFDVPSLEFLVKLGVPAIKLASASIANTELLSAVGQTGIPTILSTGGADLTEIDQAADLLRGVPHALMLCTAEYPCPPEDMNLRCVETMRSVFPDTVIGLSDHYDGIALTEMALPLGARIFEKHFTLHRSWKGGDQAWSLEPGGMARLVRDLRRGHLALGDGQKRVYESERAPLMKMGRRFEERVPA